MAEAIDYFAYKNPFIKLKTFFSLKARGKMYKKFQEICEPTSNDRVLDLGATPDTILADSNFFEKLYPWKEKITVASIEDCSALVEEYGLNGFVKTEPKRPLPFADKEFDILFSSAVLEHVGSRENQAFFLEECLRVADRVFLTTPYRYFPIEMHTFMPFLHWLPWKVFQRIITPIRGGFWANIDNLNLLSKKDAMALSDNISVCFIKTLLLKSNMIIMNQ